MSAGTRLQRKAAAAADAPNHWREQEADRLADKALALPDPAPASVAPSHARTTPMPGPTPGSMPAQASQVLAQTGRPLDAGLQQDMGRRFGHDFARVRVHTDHRAGQSARALQAQAYTVGNALVFAPGRFAPATGEGRRLIAHELAHVTQQARPGASVGLQRRLEFRAPGRGEASAIGRAQELVDRFNRLSGGLRYALNGGELTYTVLDAAKLTHFDTVMQGFIDRAELVPMRLITREGRVGGGTLFGDSLQEAYVDVDDMMADDDFSFQSDFLHFLTERFQVRDYARRIGTDMSREFPRAHRAGKNAEALQLQSLLADPSIEFLYEELKANDTWVNAFRSRTHRYRVFQVVQRSERATAGGRMWVQRRDGSRASMDDFIRIRAGGGT